MKKKRTKNDFLIYIKGEDHEICMLAVNDDKNEIEIAVADRGQGIYNCLKSALKDLPPHEVVIAAKTINASSLYEEDRGKGRMIRLHVHPAIILEFETEILGTMIKIHGSIVWTKELKADIYQYGVEFLIDENERSDLAKILNRLAVLLRKNPIVPDCRFVQVDRYKFFNQKEQAKKMYI
jgi:hypothetical protein